MDADTGGSDSDPLEITWYHLYLDDGLGGEFSLYDSISGALNVFTVQYLRPGLEYRFKM